MFGISNMRDHDFNTIDSEVHESQCSGFQTFVIKISIFLTRKFMKLDVRDFKHAWSQFQHNWLGSSWNSMFGISNIRDHNFNTIDSEVHETQCAGFQTFVITISIQLTRKFMKLDVRDLKNSWSQFQYNWLGSSWNSMFSGFQTFVITISTQLTRKFMKLNVRNFKHSWSQFQYNWLGISWNSMFSEFQTFVITISTQLTRKFMKLNVRDFKHSWSQFQYNWLEIFVTLSG